MVETVAGTNLKAAFRQRTGTKTKWWQNARLAELLVFLNGIALTATAFLTLLAFINETRDVNFLRQANALYYSSARALQDLEQSVGIIVSDLRKGNSLETIREDMPLYPAFAGKQRPFERLMVFSFSADGAETANDMISLSSSGYMSAQDPKDYRDVVVRQIKRNGLPTVSEVASSELSQDWKGTGRTTSRAVLLVVPIVKDGRVVQAIAGVIRLDNTLRDVFTGTLVGRDSVSRMVTRLPEGNTKLFLFSAATDKNHDVLPIQSFDKSWDLSLFGQKLMFDLTLQEDSRMAFLGKVPFLMLLFGLTLTLIGTFYIRNNFRASSRLSLMNGALSDKNFELKQQIDESSRLFGALQKSEREYRAIIDGVSDIIFECDSAGVLVFVNATWEKITGTSAGSAMGRDLFSLMEREDKESLLQGFGAMVNGSLPFARGTTRLKTAGGGWRAVDVSFNRKRQDEQDSIRILGTITDIEERRRTERALAETEKKYRTIVENAATGIYQITPEGVILSGNPAFARILGYESIDRLTMAVPDVTALYVNSRDRIVYERDLNTSGSIRNFESRIRRADGSMIWVSESARAVREENGRVIYFEGSMEDVTERRESALALQEAKTQSDLANRAKSEFISNMSHELRTPLNAIIGFSEILKNEALGTIGKREYIEYARDINDSGQRLMNIINDILDISRIEAGERVINDTLFSVNKVMDTCVNLVSARAEEGSVRIVNHLADSLPKIIGEELAFKQILTNLLSNAVKFTMAGGQVTIDCEYAGEGRDMRLSVTDTGIGMDSAEIHRAMAPFTQLNADLSRGTSGTGLGLTLVDSLVRLHDGKLEILSKKGVGTTVTVVIPARRVAVGNGSAAFGGGNVTLFARGRSE